MDDVPWHAIAASDAVERLGTDAERGLSQVEAANRLDLHGPNAVVVTRRWVKTRRLADQFNDVLIWLLLGAAAVSGILLGARVDAAAITAIVILNAVLGYVQESRADHALQRLAAMSAPEALVIRDGSPIRITATELVPGDMVVLEAGDQIPADARVVMAAGMQAAEAALTGEAFPVAKSPRPADPNSSLGDRTSMVFASTTIAAGRGTAVVTATGHTTEAGRIAEMVARDVPETPLQIELDRVGRRIALVAIAAATLIFGAGMARSYPVETMVLTAVALAVAAIPEGLPAVVTVSLTGGVHRMADERAIVRRLPAVEALGAVDVICTDKTGTLTLNDLRVQTIFTAAGREPPSALGDPKTAAGVLGRIAALCNNADDDATFGDPTDVALARAASEAGVDIDALHQDMPRVDEIAFDSTRKRMTTLHETATGVVMMVKGAPEVLLERSLRVMGASGDPGFAKEQMGEAAEDLAGAGLRTLAFARRSVGALPEDPAREERDLEFVGIVGLSDQVRVEVRDAVAEAARAGVITVMVTGDHRITAAAVAREVGLREGRVMPGPQLGMLDEDELAASVADYSVFARVDPADKVKIVGAWRRHGATVAMTGDGVNDAPALRAADIGVAMGSGTDVAREASTLVLADDNYATIVAAIREGRRIFANLRNVVHYLLSANASEVLYMVTGFLAFGFLGEPLIAVQLLWINLLSDALPALALGMDVPTRDLMEDPPGSGRDILSRNNLTVLLGQAVVLAAAALATMGAGHFVLELDFDATRTMVFSTLVLAQLIHAINVRSAGGNLAAPRPLLTGAILSSAVLQVGVVMLPIGNTVFSTEPLTLAAWLWVGALSALSFLGVRLLNIAVTRAAVVGGWRAIAGT